MLKKQYRNPWKFKTVVSPEQQINNTDSQNLGNRLIDFHSLIDVVESNTLCRFCGSRVKVSEETVGIATSIKLNCTKCSLNKSTKCKRTKLDRNAANKKWKVVESFAANVQLVLGLQQIGGGPADCQVITSYLELSHSSSFSRKSFSRIGSKLGPIIRSVCDRSMKDAVEEEVRLTRSPHDFIKWKNNDLPAQANGLTVCYDMG